ncbi:MAG: histidine--tRNA ligase [Patescibacteria group bacterium]|nr:histidine--tRNA ligase [Patescibacteria group bacterium]
MKKIKTQKNKNIRASAKKQISKSVEKKVKKIEEQVEVKHKSGKTFNVLRGMKDILPPEEKYWRICYHAAENLAKFFQFGRIETPLLEEANLFIRSIGKGTDVVDKEMYVFEDSDGEKICLRPEATASIARAYIGHGMWNNSQPVKLWYWGPMFRHDRPQAGRYREFFQVGFETLGNADPSVDAELILVAYNFYKDLGLPVNVRVNSIGFPEERQRYKTALADYYRAKRNRLCDDCKHRLAKNPLRLLDCKQEQCQSVKEDAPQIVDWLEEESKNHLMKVVEYLDELSIPYVLDPTLVRGLDYYTRTVFEIYTAFEGVENTSAQSALGGGGRYDLLAEQMGGRPVPAGGFALGVERAILAIKQFNELNKIEMPQESPDLFFAQLGDKAKKRAMKIINDLRNSGLKIGYNFTKDSLKSQLEIANSQKIPYALILGQKEVQDNSIIIRDMESGNQEIVDQQKIKAIMLKKIGIK